MTDQTPKCQTDGHQVNNKGGKPYLQHSASTTPGGRSYRTFSKEPYQRYNPKARPQNQGFTKVERPFQPGPPRGGTPTKTTVLIPLDTHFNGSSVHFSTYYYHSHFHSLRRTIFVGHSLRELTGNRSHLLQNHQSSPVKGATISAVSNNSFHCDNTGLPHLEPTVTA